MRKSLMIAAAVAALCVPASLSAQAMQPERIENVTWHMVEMIKFHPGKRGRAMEIIENYFAAADRDLGETGVTDLHFDTGEWDVIVAFPLSGGPSDLTWATSPDDIKWMNALAARAGGMDKAQALLTEWDTLVAQRQQNVAHRHPDW